MTEIPFGRPDITDVDREAVMRVLDGRDGVTARRQAGDDFGQQRGFSGAAPAGQSNDAHGAIIVVTSARWGEAGGGRTGLLVPPRS